MYRHIQLRFEMCLSFVFERSRELTNHNKPLSCFLSHLLSMEQVAQKQYSQIRETWPVDKHQSIACWANRYQVGMCGLFVSSQSDNDPTTGRKVVMWCLNRVCSLLSDSEVISRASNDLAWMQVKREWIKEHYVWCLPDRWNCCSTYMASLGGTTVHPPILLECICVNIGRKWSFKNSKLHNSNQT